ATSDAVFINNNGMVIAHAEPRAFRYTSVRRESDGRRVMIGVPRIQYRILDRFKIPAFFESRAVFGADGYWTTRAAENVYQADFFNLQFVPPEFAVFPIPRTEIKAAFIVVEAVEDKLVLLPILRFLDVKSLETDGMLGI